MTAPRILIVEDETALCSILTELLELESYVVRTCDDLASACEELDESRFDAAMIDVFLDGRPAGIDLARQILSKCPGTRVILMTGYADRAEVDAACLAGAYTCIAKPFNLDDVVRVVGMALTNSENELGAVGDGSR